MSNIEPIITTDQQQQQPAATTQQEELPVQGQTPPVGGETEPKPETEVASKAEEAGKAEEAEGEEGEVEYSSPFAPFQDLRKKMQEAGVDFSVMDSKVGAGEKLSEAEVSLIAEYGGYRPEEVSAFMDMVYAQQEYLPLAKEHQESQKQAYLKEIDTLAGGSYSDLTSFVAKNANPAQVKIWNHALKSEDPDLQRATVEQMAQWKAAQPLDSVSNANVNQGADLSLLTTANSAPVPSNTPKPEVGDEAEAKPADPLEGNSLASLPLQSLLQILNQPSHPSRAEAVAALNIRYPGMYT